MNVHVGITHTPGEDTSYGRPDAGRYKLRVSDYLLLDKAGTFRDYETELVDGDVIIMSPEWIPHMRVKDELAYQLRRSIKRKRLELLVGTGGSVALSDVDNPRPDVIVASQLSGNQAVEREWIKLLIEVSSTTLSFDIGDKAALYARHRIPEYWIDDLNARIVHRMWSPSGAIYSKHDKVKFGKRVSSTSIDRLAIATTALRDPL